MNELALATFATATGTHVVQEPRSARFARFRAEFDDRAERERLARAGLRFLGRSERPFPPLLRAIHDPPPGLFLSVDSPTRSVRIRPPTLSSASRTVTRAPNFSAMSIAKSSAARKAASLLNCPPCCCACATFKSAA